MTNREHYIKCILAGGGLLSALSSLPVVSGCMCIWGVAGGLLAGYLLVRSSSHLVTMGEGLFIGFLAGVFATIITALLWWFNMEVINEQFISKFIESSGSGMDPSIIWIFFSGTILVAFSIESSIGGLLAAYIWAPKKFPEFFNPPHKLVAQMDNPPEVQSE